MSLFQLKPTEQSFYQICRDLTRKLRVIILCEGDNDTKTLKTLIAKMGIQMTGSVGITDCGGTPAIREIAAYVATLTRLSRRLEKIVIIIDADEHSVEQKFQSLTNSLRAKNVVIINTETVSESIYRVETEDRDILAKIAGLMTLPFQSHAMEDYTVQLLIIRNEVKESQLDGFDKAKDFLNEIRREPEDIIRQSQNERVEQAFENVINLLRLLS